MTLRQTAAEALLGAITWESSDLGFCKCPGENLHTHNTKSDHCRVTLNGVPTIYCFHSSCEHAVATVNHQLRSDIWKIEHGKDVETKPYVPTPEDLERLRKKRADDRLRAKTLSGKVTLLEQHAFTTAAYVEESPVPLCARDTAEDWRLLLNLFQPSDVVWIGRDTRDSANPGHNDEWIDFCRTRFRTAGDWQLEKTCPGNFTCPNVFKTDCYSRSNANVLAPKYLVVESDSLDKNQMASLLNWQRSFLKLRAIVDTAGKSLHGWFDYPDAATLHELQIILPALGCDPALFIPSQPCRLPGALRDGKFQSLIYLDLEGKP